MAGGGSPDPCGADRKKNGFYEGGMEVAPQTCSYYGAGPQREGPSAPHYELRGAHLQSTPTKLGEGRIHFDEECVVPTGAGFSSAGFEMMDRDLCRTREKEDAQPTPEVRTLGSVGHVLHHKFLEVISLRGMSMGRCENKALFPLPTSRDVLLEMRPDLDCDVVIWTISLCFALNSLWGTDAVCEAKPNKCQKKCLGELVDQCIHFCNLSGGLTDISWEDFFKVRTVDYCGEEVKVGRWFTWANISPALPSEIGRVPLEDVCSLGCRHYVSHFDEYLKPPDQWHTVKAPRVMVEDSSWGAVCSGLLTAGVCCLIEESEVFHVDGVPLLNGLFGVSKEEWTDDGIEIFRLIMNLIPLNNLCLPLAGDVDTLPSWGAMNSFYLQPGEELLISSEDVKCFFYTMRVPSCWVKFLAFNKMVPNEVLPSHLQGNRVYLASTVLPMGFLNSVSLAQHVHRNLVAWSRTRSPAVAQGHNAPEQELRKDRAFTVGNPNWRVYLDNYDLLERVQTTLVDQLQGTVAPGVAALREEYRHLEVPRNQKKAVERASKCEMQGATVDGRLGVAYPRETKLCRYLSLALTLLSAKFASQKQWQVVCGGLVYVSMFRRPLLGSLNAVWHHIEDFNKPGPRFRCVPPLCRLEVLRFLCLFPLAGLNFRLDVHPVVTCSDASTTGGGICASLRTTDVGVMVAQGGLRGEIPEPVCEGGILAIGLFDGIGALRVALELLNVPVIGYVSVERHEPARRVVERNYPGVIHCADVTQVSASDVKDWSVRFSQASLVIIGAGPPCQGVSGLNYDRKGALRDERSCLFAEVPRIRDEVKKNFPWCPVFVLMESVASMDQRDRDIMSAAIGGSPLKCDAGTLTWCHRPRLYWCDWEIIEMEGYVLEHVGSSEPGELKLQGAQDLTQVIRAGWKTVEPAKSFPTFTTSRPSPVPGRKPAGIKQCSLAELERWSQDLHRFPPYQYCAIHSLVNSQGQLRVPDVSERELMLGFPLHYTAGCLPKHQQKGDPYNDCRLTLLGNTWSVIVVACLLNQLLARLGLTQWQPPQQVVDRTTPGQSPLAQGRLFRLPLNRVRQVTKDSSKALAEKLANLVSIKGEDILLTTPTSQQTKFHRLRATVPSKCWKWQVIAGWKWCDPGEHINSLELRAILTALRWRVEHAGHLKTRFLHLTDSLVCLHALSRGRSSSRKLRRTMSRINALILASGTQPLWGYVHTDQNPADKPSRWGRQVRTKFRNAKA